MDDVEVFYAELRSASATLQTSVTDLLTENADVFGEDTGIENPAMRAGLRLEMHRRLTQLHDRVSARVENGSDVARGLTVIADRYTDLDIELTGREQQ